MAPPNNVIAWRIDPMPDFLLDHTLTEEQWPARLREVVTRWVQLVGALWRWQNQATFAIRFQSDCSQIQAFVIARCEEPKDLALVDEDLSVLFRSHGIPVTRADNLSLASEHSPFWDLGGKQVFAEVRQYENRRLWSFPKRILSNAQLRREYAWLPESSWEHVPHLFPWWAPGGPFLLPLEKLVSQSVPCSITTYLTPTILTPQEWSWLSLISKTAQSVGDFQEQALDQAMAERRVDPAAMLAGRLAMANLRRLSDKPFMVSVQCAAGQGASSAALSVAGTIEAMVYEAPFDRPSQEDNRLPSAAEVRLANDQSDEYELERAKSQYNALQSLNENKGDDSGDPLRRLPYLVDARGAATVFRLPVNVRGGVPGFRVSQRPPDFHPGPRHTSLPAEHVLIGRLHQGGLATVHRDQFTKHALITGFTGSGKTVTVLSLVHQLHDMGIPVLVIESAKHEYRSLVNVPAFQADSNSLWVFTAGNESCAPIRLNPFELLPGVRLESHISRLQTCFEAALPPIGPLASMIGEALIDVYQRLGWRLTDIGPDIGEVLTLRFPTIGDFYTRMSELVEERGYEGEVRSNVSAAVLGRIKPLTIGTKGLMFQNDHDQRIGTERRPSLIAEVFKRSTVIELNDLNIEDKALVTMFLLTFLREFREKHAASDGRLIHAAVVEEAHNILENVATTGGSEGGSADTRFKAVQAFSHLLTEIRALGQSLIIVDQSPEKLAPDALRNTNIQIAHQLRDSKDRESVARAMMMEDEQMDYLGKLVPGQAAFFATGLEKATFIQVPQYRGQSSNSNKSSENSSNENAMLLTAPSDETIRSYMTPVTGAFRSGPFGIACETCKVRLTCDHRKGVLASIADGDKEDQFHRLADRYRKDRSIDRTATVEGLVRISVQVAKQSSVKPDDSVAWCAFVHLWHRDPFNWTQAFPVYSHDTLLSVVKSKHPELLEVREPNNVQS